TAPFGGLGFNGSPSSGNGTVFRLAFRSTGAPPVIVSQPLSQTVFIGSTASFNVTASGAPPLSYFWRRNGTSIPGATASTHTLNNVQFSDSGSKFSCVVSNGFGSITSSIAQLTVIRQGMQL